MCHLRQLTSINYHLLFKLFVSPAACRRRGYIVSIPVEWGRKITSFPGLPCSLLLGLYITQKQKSRSSASV